jgi:hypothetical protein
MFETLRPFTREVINGVGSEPGVYIVFDSAGPIYTGRSGKNIQERLIKHVTKRGSRTIKDIMRGGEGQSESLMFSYAYMRSGDERVAEAVLQKGLQGVKFGNRRQEKISEDWSQNVGKEVGALMRQALKELGPACARAQKKRDL